MFEKLTFEVYEKWQSKWGGPAWSQYSSDKGQTMILYDNPCIENEPDDPARKNVNCLENL